MLNWQPHPAFGAMQGDGQDASVSGQTGISKLYPSANFDQRVSRRFEPVDGVRGVSNMNENKATRQRDIGLR
jgi:hypothetical protein